MAQQTAVDWLFIQLYEKFEMKGDGMEMDKVLEQSKQMEREQKEEEYKRGWEEAKSAAVKYVEEFTTRLQNETN